MKPLLAPSDLAPKSWTPPVSWYRSRVYWRIVSQRIAENPEILAQSRRHLVEALDTGKHSCSEKYLTAWIHLIDRGVEAVIEVLDSDGDDMDQALRSCAPLPLLDLLPESERLVLHEQVGREVARARKESEAR